MYKGLMIILDGLGDRPGVALNGQTPLQAANTPVMDKLLAAGSCGLVDPLSAGFPVDTHTGTAALMGVAQHDLLSLARGPVEAAGVGVDMQPGDILLRANFATFHQDGSSIIDRRAGRISNGTSALAETLQNVDLGEDISASVFTATHHRAVVRLRGIDLSPDISNTDPCSSLPEARLLTSHALDPTNKKALRTARALNSFMQIAHSCLKIHPLNKKLKLPANGLLTRGAGIASIPDNLLNRLNLKTAVISGERTLHGLGRLCGFNVIDQPEFTATAETDLEAKFTAVSNTLLGHDIVYLHIKATDIFSHNKDAPGKSRFLETIDTAMQKAVQKAMQEKLVIAISGDHSTDSNTGNHSGDAVPSLLYAPDCRIDSQNIFSELACYQGGLGRVRASSFLLSMLDHMGRLQNYQPFDAPFIGY